MFYGEIDEITITTCFSFTKNIGKNMHRSYMHDVFCFFEIMFVISGRKG